MAQGPYPVIGWIRPSCDQLFAFQSAAFLLYPDLYDTMLWAVEPTGP